MKLGPALSLGGWCPLTTTLQEQPPHTASHLQLWRSQFHGLVLGNEVRTHHHHINVKSPVDPMRWLQLSNVYIRCPPDIVL